jgi:hypothetical protein
MKEGEGFGEFGLRLWGVERIGRQLGKFCGDAARASSFRCRMEQCPSKLAILLWQNTGTSFNSLSLISFQPYESQDSDSESKDLPYISI